MPWRDVITEEESPEFALCLALDNQAFMFRSVDALVAKTCRPAEWIREVVAAHPDLVRRSNGQRETYGLVERIGNLEPAVLGHQDSYPYIIIAKIFIRIHNKMSIYKFWNGFKRFLMNWEVSITNLRI